MDQQQILRSQDTSLMVEEICNENEKITQNAADPVEDQNLKKIKSFPILHKSLLKESKENAISSNQKPLTKCQYICYWICLFSLLLNVSICFLFWTAIYIFGYPF